MVDHESLPERPDGPLRVVIDTDAANEIDDQFALAWALSAPNRLNIEAICAAPFGHGDYMASLSAALELRDGGPTSMWEDLAGALTGEQITTMTLEHPAAEGMGRSFVEIERVVAAARRPAPPRVLTGATRFMAGPADSVDSDAAQAIVELAHSSDEPLYVAVLGAPTNVAAALLADPSIADRVVVVFVAGYPSGSGRDDDSFNLVQDRAASNVVFERATAMVYIPGYQVAEVLSVSLPEIEAHVRDTGELGRLLHALYLDNPLATDADRPGHSWVMWDLAPIAWMIDPSWVRTAVVPRACVGVDHRWRPLEGHMTEAFRIDRRAVYTDFFTRLRETLV